MTNNLVTKDHLVQMLSSLDVDGMASIIVRATLRDRAMPMDAIVSLLNLVSTCALMMDTADRVTVVDRMRRVSDLIEAELLPGDGIP